MKTLNVLIVDDSRDDAVLLEEMLRSGGFLVSSRQVETPEGLQEEMANQFWDIVLCDNNMPELDARRALDIVCRHRPETPFIIVSGGLSEEAASGVMKIGASDYISKHCLSRLVPAVAREVRRSGGRGFDSKRLAGELKQKLAGREGAALFLVEPCRYRDFVGHAGEALLSVFSERLAGFALGGRVWRYREGVFALVLPAGGSSAEEIARGISESFRRPLLAGNEEWFLGCRIGGSLHSGQDSEELLRQAETALDCARQSGGPCFYMQGMEQRARERIEMEKALFQAARNEEFDLAYQPQYDLVTGRIIGAEALLRWNWKGNRISPAVFIPLLEETDLIQEVGEWVLRKACSFNRSMQQEGLPPIRMAVNLSAIQFRQAGLAGKVERALQDSGLEPRHFALEITENIAMHHGSKIVSTLNELKEMGVELALDDFGTGYSSLAYLKNFPMDKLKIDQSFVRGMIEDKSSEAIVRWVISIAESFGLGLIAEGVEAAEQAALLRQWGCSEAQGFHYCPPVSEEELKMRLAAA